MKKIIVLKKNLNISYSSYIYDRFLLVVGLVSVVLTGCISVDYCRTVNTYKKGYSDALDGKTEQSFDKTVRSCAEHKVKLNLKEYNKGWKAGFKVFCTYKKGYKLGLKGEEYHGICSGSADFLKGYQEGDKKCLYEEGYSHALQGESSSIFSFVNCLKLSKTEEVVKEYTKGRREGLKKFCTYKGGHKFGLKGGKYQNICPKLLEADFLKGYNVGFQEYREWDAYFFMRSLND